MTPLLLDEPPILVMPKLATKIGLNEAIILQQIHYWLKIKEDKQDKDSYIHGRYWVYNSYEQWQKQFPFWSIPTIKRFFSKLEKEGLLICGNFNKARFDKTKWYSIDYQVLYHRIKLIPSSDQNDPIVGSYWYDGTDQNDPTNTIEYTKITTKNTTESTLLYGAELKKENHNIPFDCSVLKKQIIKSCNKQEIENPQPYIDIIVYYYSAYMQIFHQEHKRISTKAMDSVIKAINCGFDEINTNDFDTYRSMIDKHFQTVYTDCDYSICHFMTDGIRKNRFFETGV